MSDKQLENKHGESGFKACSACGAAALRLSAKFCNVCGHDLREDYMPLDSLRASYNLREKSNMNLQARKSSDEMKKIFAENKNGASSTAMAFVVYSLVPYLGILFCPGALLMGSIGLAVSYHKPQLGGRAAATYSLLFGSIVLAIQILLWWLLYLIPELSR